MFRDMLNIYSIFLHKSNNGIFNYSKNYEKSFNIYCLSKKLHDLKFVYKKYINILQKSVKDITFLSHL